MVTRVKICGITMPSHAIAAAEAGCHAIGIMCYEKSKRYVDINKAKQICAVLPPFITIVAVFVDPSVELVQQVITHLPISLLQFHGQETPAFCRQFSLPYIKAIAMRAGVDLKTIAHDYQDCKGLLLDTYDPDIAGGTGKHFDWSLVPQQSSKPLILAGGLTPDNVTEAITQTRPFAVDVSGGVESAPGVKDPEKIKAFMAGVQRGDQAIKR